MLTWTFKIKNLDISNRYDTHLKVLDACLQYNALPRVKIAIHCLMKRIRLNEKNRRRRIPWIHGHMRKISYFWQSVSCQLHFWVFHIERKRVTYCMLLQTLRIDIPFVFLLVHVDSYCRLLRHRSYRYLKEVVLRRQFDKVWDDPPLSRQTMSLHYEKISFEMKSSNH